jgi:prepilin-type processing-associated H-X9-DG protein
VEVIAVVAVISILAGLLVPAVQGMVVAGQRAECASNLRQVGTGILLYSNDNNGFLPGTTHELGTDIERAWIFALKPYLGGVDKVRICPADPKGAERLAANGTSYILNSFVFVPRVGPFGEALPGSLNNVRYLSEPSKTLFASNVSDRRGASVQNDHTHSELWDGSWARLCADLQPDRFTQRADGDQLNGSANYLFGDGHVENIAAKEVKARLDRGENIARPPELREQL